MSHNDIRNRWLKYLNPGRLAQSKTEDLTHAKGRSQFERDYDRVVFTGAFRRMQDKTQVYPFSATDFTRTRLTHSIEVSCVGRSFGTLVGQFLRDMRKIKNEPSELSALVSAACLAHDIGNPPFGHSGEYAMQKWAREYLAPKSGKLGLESGEINDFLRFDGNAQSFRILTRFYSRERAGGIRPTYAFLGALTKYPCSSTFEDDSGNVAWKKFGFFQDDLSAADEAFSFLGISEVRSEKYHRHPLAFLMEAADDICNAVIDVEDACKQGLVSTQRARELFAACLLPDKGEDDPELEDESRNQRLRALAINSLAFDCMATFRNNFRKITYGEFSSALIEKCSLAEPVKVMKRVVRKTAFPSRDVVLIECAGFRTLSGLLGIFADAVLAEKPDKEQDKLISLFPYDQFIEPGRRKFRKRDHRSLPPYKRLLAVTDFVSGMTDRFATDLYQRLSGIKLT